jgi:L,D-peptidoglycan transpeptidase YkuD (ErfK/YbiS/YcfS/YnhG family)
MKDTKNSQQIITVTNEGGSSTYAVVRAYQKTSSGWKMVYGPYTARIGSEGFSYGFNESNSHSPIGFYTLTQAFGNYGNPGTSLPYHNVKVGDVWVDDPHSPNYNTLQTNDANGSKGTGENLWTISLYNHAVVIDYNTSARTPGAGSAVFFHITNGQATAGCVAIADNQLVTLMKWLDPAKHPRMAMGPMNDVLGM